MINLKNSVIKFLLAFYLIVILTFSLSAVDAKELLSKAVAFENSGEYEKALLLYEEFYSKTKDERVLLKICRLIPGITEAVSRYNDFFKAFPKSRFRYLARYELAVLLMINGDCISALNQFKLLSALSHGTGYYDKALINIAAIEFNVGNYENAVKNINELFQNSNDYEIIGSAYYLLGKIMLKQGDTDEAENYLLTCAGTFPQCSRSPASLIELIDIYMTMKKYQYVLKINDILTRLYPGSHEGDLAKNKVKTIRDELKSERDSSDDLQLIELSSEFDRSGRAITRLYNDINLSLKIDGAEVSDSNNDKRMMAETIAFYVQISYLVKEENAKSLVDYYRKIGIDDVFYAKTRSSNDSKICYRVIIGPYNSREDASKKIIELKEKNIEAIILELEKSVE